MGRIKTAMVKRTANSLVIGVEDFSDNFEHNKKLLKNTMPSKSIRNKVAGYIARMKRQQMAKKENRIKKISEDDQRENRE
jgi:ribosomal protein S17E